MDSVSNLVGVDLEKSFEEQAKDMNESEKNRVLAILNCYGVEAYKNQKEITINETGEKIIAWHCHGIVSKADLQAMFPLEIIIGLYDINKEDA